jgi:hypothetical protein
LVPAVTQDYPEYQEGKEYEDRKERPDFPDSRVKLVLKE